MLCMSIHIILHTHTWGKKQIHPINYVFLCIGISIIFLLQALLYFLKLILWTEDCMVTLYNKMAYYFKIYLTYNSNSAINVLVWLFLVLMFKKNVNYALLSCPNAHKSIFYISKIHTTLKVLNNFLFFLRFPSYFSFSHNVVQK